MKLDTSLELLLNQSVIPAPKQLGHALRTMQTKPRLELLDVPANKLIPYHRMQLSKTDNFLLFVEHYPVYTLGKSGDINNLLTNMESLIEKNIEFFKTNRGGDITFHGPGQVVVYPILDLEYHFR